MYVFTDLFVRENDFHNRFETKHILSIGVMDDISKAPDNEESIA
jgi:hypothetical protein